MAKNVIGYLSNISKSISYSAVDKVKNMTPATTEFVEKNSDLFKSVYSNVRDYKLTFKRSKDVFEKSKIYEAGNVLKTSLIEDIKSGKLYNKEREDQAATKLLGMDMDNSFDIDDGFNFEDMMKDFDLSDTDVDVSVGDRMVSSSISSSSKKSSEMISMVTARTGEYIVENQKMNTNLLYTQNIQTQSILSSGLGTINQNMGSMIEFSNNVLKSHVDNSAKYFDNATKLMQDQTALLRRIADSLAPEEKKTEKKSEKVTYDDIVGTSGAPDIKLYLSAIKQNISNMTGMMSSMNSMFGEDSNILATLASSPLKFIPNMIVDKFVPQMVEESIGNFDKSLSGFFGSLMTKFNTMADKEDNFLESTIGKILGIKTGLKDSIDTSKYNKGKVDWDGKSKKALEEVIPSQLSKIISLLSGENERIYNYEKGKFVSTESIEKEYENMKNSYRKSATSDMQDFMEKYMDQLLTFNTMEDKDKFKEDIENLLTTLYRQNKLFDYNSKTLEDDYSDYGVSSAKNIKLLRAMFKSAPKYMQQQINNEIMDSRASQNKNFKNLEEEGSGVINYLFNGFNINEYLKGKDTEKYSKITNSLNSTVDKYGRNIFYYLQNIYKELSYMRQYGSESLNSVPSSHMVQDNMRIVSSSGSEYHPEQATIDSIRIAQSPSRSRRELEMEELTRKRERFMREEEKKREKNSDLINYDDDDEALIASKIVTGIEKDSYLEAIESNARRPKTIMDRLLEAESLTDKFGVVLNKIDELSKKPSEFITSVVQKADERMFEFIYGPMDPNADRSFKGFLNHALGELRNTFSKFNTFIDENILEPIKDKLLGEGRFKEYLKGFGIDIDEIKKQIKGFLFGNDERDGFFKPIIDSLKDTGKNIFSTIKDSFLRGTEPIRNMFKFNRNQNNNENNNEEEYEYDQNGNVRPRNESVQERIDRLTGVSNNRNNEEGRTQEYYNNINWDSEEDRNYLDKLTYVYGKNKINNHTDRLREIRNSLRTNTLSEDERNRLKSESNHLQTVVNDFYTSKRRYTDKLKNKKFNNVKDYYMSTLAESLDINNEDMTPIINRLFENNADTKRTNFTIKDIIDSALDVASESDFSELHDNILNSLTNNIEKFYNNDENTSLFEVARNGYEKKKFKSEQDISNLSTEEYFNMLERLTAPDEVEENTSEQNINTTSIRGGSIIHQIFDILENGFNEVKTIITDISTNTRQIVEIFNSIPNGQNRPIQNGPLMSLNPELVNTAEGRATHTFAQDLVTMISNWMYDRTPHFDQGGVIHAPTVATVGEGEVVLTADTVNEINKIFSQINSDTPNDKVYEASVYMTKQLENQLNIIDELLADLQRQSNTSEEYLKQLQEDRDTVDYVHKIGLLSSELQDKYKTTDFSNKIKESGTEGDKILNSILDDMTNYSREKREDKYVLGSYNESLDKLSPEEIEKIKKYEDILSKERMSGYNSSSRVMDGMKDYVMNNYETSEQIPEELAKYTGRDMLPSKSSFKYIMDNMLSDINAYNNGKEGNKYKIGDYKNITEKLSPAQLKQIKYYEEVLGIRRGIKEEERNVSPDSSKEDSNMIKSITDELVDGAKIVSRSLFGDSKIDNKKFGEAVSDVTKNISDYAPDMIGKGLIGAGVSLLTGAVGGPLLGAAAGAGYSLMKNSSSVQKFLFGEIVDGKRQGGLIGKNLIEKYKQYMPDMKTYGITGGILGLLTPFGPLGGMMIGSGLGFVKNNDAVMRSLFGEAGLFKDEAKAKLRKALPKIGAGALIGTMVGPFGLMGNLLLGSGIGFATSMDGFKEALIGRYDEEDKEYKGGLLPAIRDGIVKPLREIGTGIRKNAFSFIKKHMLKPVASAIDPIKKEISLIIKNGIKGVVEYIKGLFKETFVPIAKWFQDKVLKRIMDPVMSFTKKAIKVAAHTAAMPFKAVGKLGDALKTKHIKNGDADYLDAADRLNFAKEKGIKYNNKFDEYIKGLSKEEAESVFNTLSSVNNKGKTAKKLRKQAGKEIGSHVSTYLDYDSSVEVMSMFKQGNMREIEEYLNKNKKGLFGRKKVHDLSEEQKNKLINYLNYNYDNYHNADKKQEMMNEERQKLYKELKDRGFGDINDENVGKYLSMLDKEVRSKRVTDPTKFVDESQLAPAEKLLLQERREQHKDIMNILQQTLEAVTGVKQNTEDSEETQKNIAEEMIEENNNRKEESTTRVDDNGNVMELIRGTDGELKPDLSDSSTKAAIKEAQEDDEREEGILTALTNLANNNNKREDDKEKKEPTGILGMLSKITGLLGKVFNPKMLGLISSALTMIPILPQILKIISEEGFEGLITHLPGLILDGIKKNITEYIPSFTKGIFDYFNQKNGDDKSVIERGEHTLFRHAVTGNRVSKAGLTHLDKLGKASFKILKGTEKKTIVGKTIGALSKPFKLMSPVTGAKVAGKLSFNTIPKAALGVAETAGNAVNMAFDKISDKTGIKAIREKFESKVTGALSKKADKIAEKAAEISGKSLDERTISKFINKIGEFLPKLITNEKVVKLIGSETAQKLIKDFTPAFLEILSKRLLKEAPKIAAKLGGAFFSMGILNIAFAVGDFISGYNDARDILGLTVDQEPTLSMKVTCGLIKAINGVFIITSLIPERLYVDMILNTISGAFPNLQKMRKDAKDKVKQYKEKYKKDKNFTVQDYNKEMRELNKQKDKYDLNGDGHIGFLESGLKLSGQALDTVVKWGKNAWNATKDAIGGLGNFISNTSSNIYNGFKNFIGVGKGLGTAGRGYETAGKGPDQNTQYPDKINNFTYYSQYDPRWNKEKIGGTTVKAAGCGPSSMAMIVSQLTGQVHTPDEFVKDAYEHKQWSSNGAEWTMFKYFADKYSLPYQEAKTYDRFQEMAAQGIPQAVSGRKRGVDGSPFTNGGHIITVLGTDGNGQYIVNDPVSPERSKLYPNDIIQKGWRNSWGFGTPGTYNPSGAGMTFGGNQQNQVQQEQPKTGIEALMSDLVETGTKSFNQLYGFDKLSNPTSSIVNNNIENNSSAGQGVNKKDKDNPDLDIDSLLDSIETDTKAGKGEQEFNPILATDFQDDSIINKIKNTKEYKNNPLFKEKPFRDPNNDNSLLKDLYNKSKYYNGMGGAIEDLTTEDCEDEKNIKEDTKTGKGGAIWETIKNAAKVSLSPVFGIPLRKANSQNSNAQQTDQTQNQNQNPGPGMVKTVKGIKIGTDQLSPDVTRYNSIFQSAGNEFRVDPELLKAICMQESGGKPLKAAAWGLMQIENGGTTDEFIQFGSTRSDGPYTSNDRLEPAKAIPFAAKRLSDDFQHYSGDYLKATQSYNFSRYSLDKLLQAFPNGDDWLGQRVNVGQYNGTHKKNYGDPEYIENVFKYYQGNSIPADGIAPGGYTGGNNQGEQQEQRSGISGLMADLTDTLTKSFNQMYGLDQISGGANSDNPGGIDASLDPNAPKVSDDWFTKTLNAQVSSPYSNRKNPTGSGTEFHPGIDYATASGTPIKTPIDGVVDTNLSESESGGFGNLLKIKDNNGSLHYFAHMNKRSNLKVGTRVKSGDVVGNVGSTGRSTGPHLHYQINTSTDRNSHTEPNGYLAKLFSNLRTNISNATGGVSGPSTNTKYNGKGGEYPTPSAKLNKPKTSNNYIKTGSITKEDTQTDETKLLSAMIDILSRILDNTTSLSQIYNLLSETFGVKINDNKVNQDINKKVPNTRGQVVNIIKDSLKDNNSINNTRLMSILDKLATE